MWKPIETAKKDNKGILGYFPRSRCIFSMVWDGDKWVSFGGDGDFYGEEPKAWMEMPTPPWHFK